MLIIFRTFQNFAKNDKFVYGLVSEDNLNQPHNKYKIIAVWTKMQIKTTFLNLGQPQNSKPHTKICEARQLKDFISSEAFIVLRVIFALDLIYQAANSPYKKKFD